MAYLFGGHGSLKAQKKFLRNRFKSIRDRLPRRTRINLSRRVCLRLAEYIQQFGEQDRTLKILVYHSIESELDLQRLIAFNFKKPIQWLLPYCPDKNTISIRYYNPSKTLELDALGIPAPDEQSILAEENQIDIALVPGLCFDRKGYRLGYGAGFYDRLLPRLTEATSIGVSFEEQIFRGIMPVETSDVQLHGLVCEKGWIRIPGNT